MPFNFNFGCLPFNFLYVELCHIIEKRQHTRHGNDIFAGKKLENGDRFGFIVDFKKRICEIVYNSKIMGSVFTEIPDEIIPVICGFGQEMMVSIHFLRAVKAN